MQTKRGEFGRKNKTAIIGIIKERLFAKAVTREKEFIFRRDHRIAKDHIPLSFSNKTWTPFPVSVEQNLRIGMICFKTVSSAFELRAQLGVIVYFAVKSDHQLFVDGGHRLRSGSDIKNRQASVPEKDSGIPIDPGAFTVRTAMGERHRSFDAEQRFLRLR